MLIYRRGSLGPCDSAPKRHLHQFTCFCTAQPCDKHTDRQISRPRYARHLLQ